MPERIKRITFCKDCANFTKIPDSNGKCSFKWEIGDATAGSGKKFEGININWIVRRVLNLKEIQDPDEIHKKMCANPCPDYVALDPEEDAKAIARIKEGRGVGA